MQDQRNLLLAIVLSVAILFGFQALFPPPEPPPPGPPVEEGRDSVPPTPQTAPAPAGAAPGAAPGAEAAAPAAPRLPIGGREGDRLRGSVALAGGRIDDLVLSDYKETTDPDSGDIRLFSPAGSASPYYAEFGWAGGDAETSALTPPPDALWTADRGALTPDRPVTLTWTAGGADGAPGPLRFERTLALDDDYMFTVTQSVVNTGQRPVTLYPYGLISRTDEPETLGFFILHEGPLGVLDGTLEEVDYGDLRDSPPIARESTGGWIGITDKYWLAALVPDQTLTAVDRFHHARRGGREKFQVDYLLPGMTVEPGRRIEVTNRLFAGAKEVTLLDRYRDELGVARFDLAVDFGWFYFLTKPFFYILNAFFGWLGNFGLAILLFTVLVRIVFFPLANKSFKAMRRLKDLQPKMMELREKFADDRQKMNEEVMALYKREKANPMAGCLPIAVQIPVFFALYKVLFVSIEMRQAPFYGWIHDLSERDPTSLFNLFGLLPFTPPEFLGIGVWPLAMGLTMFLQQKINPAPPDPIQARVLMMLPIVFTFLFATFPAGLVIYWTWNNILSIAQQWVIMRRADRPVPAPS